MAEEIHPPLPLSPGSCATRFLRFYKDEKGDIVGSLYVHDLNDERISWIALSYTWDLLLWPANYEELLCDESRYITLNNSPFQVKANLWRALNALIEQRDSPDTLKLQGWIIEEFHDRPQMNEQTYFWIDAICINQSNIAERNHQVVLMKMIYSRATLVIGWLTPRSDERFNVAVGQNDGDDAMCELSYDVRFNPYWQRMWIVQEAVLAQKLLFLIHNVWMEPEGFPPWSTDYTWGEEGSSKVPVLAVLRSRENFVASAKVNENLTLLSLIVRFSVSLCSDPRDKVFALLGLGPQDQRIQPDYRKSTLQLFIEVLHAGLQCANPMVNDSDTSSDVAVSLGLMTVNPLTSDRRCHPFLENARVFCMESSSSKTVITESNLLTAFTDWLMEKWVNTTRLRSYGSDIAFEFIAEEGEGRQVLDKIVHPAIETWIHLDALRQAKGISVAAFREIFIGMPIEYLFDPDHQQYQVAMRGIARYRRFCVELRKFYLLEHDYLYNGPMEFTSFYGKHVFVLIVVRSRNTNVPDHVPHLLRAVANTPRRCEVHMILEPDVWACKYQVETTRPMTSYRAFL